MTTLTAHVEFEDLDHQQAVVRVSTSRCFYRVAVQGDDVTVIGPGVEESFIVGADMSDDLNMLGRAMTAVVLLEETKS